MLFFLQDAVTWTWDLLSCNFFPPLFLQVFDCSSWELQENSPSRALRLLFSKKALLFAVISEANSRLGAKHASLLLRRSLSKHTERIWKVRSSDAEVRHFSYGTALKTLELRCCVSVRVCFVLETLHSPSFFNTFAWDSLVFRMTMQWPLHMISHVKWPCVNIQDSSTKDVGSMLGRSGWCHGRAGESSLAPSKALNTRLLEANWPLVALEN